MRTIKILACILASGLLLSGCSQTYTLSEMSIVQGMGIDYENGNFEITLQVLDTVKEGSGVDALSGNITTTLSQSAQTISQAIAKCSEISAKKIFIGHNNIIVFGFDLINDDITKSLDYLIRSADSRPDVLVALSKTSAKDVMKSEEKGSLIPSEAIFDLLSSGEETGVSADVSVKDLISAQISETSDIYLPVIIAEKDKPCRVEGIAIFSKSEFKTILNEDETLGFLFADNKVDRCTVTVEDSQLGKIGIEVSSSKTKTKVIPSADSLGVFSKVKIDAQIIDIEKNSNANLSEDKVKQIEKLLDEKIKTLCLNAFKTTVNQNQCDAFHIGKMLSRSSLKHYREFSKNWNYYLSGAQYSVEVKSSINKINDNSIRN